MAEQRWVMEEGEGDGEGNGEEGTERERALPTESGNAV